jgi:hypothetical protein
VYAVGLGAPIAAFVGGVVGQLVIRKGARELEKRSRREETMRNLRWAAELAVESDIRKARLGFAQLNALAGSDMLEDAEQLFVDAALESVVREPADEVLQPGRAPEVRVSLHDQIRDTDVMGGVAIELAKDSEDSNDG